MDAKAGPLAPSLSYKRASDTGGPLGILVSARPPNWSFAIATTRLRVVR